VISRTAFSDLTPLALSASALSSRQPVQQAKVSMHRQSLRCTFAVLVQHHSFGIFSCLAAQLSDPSFRDHAIPMHDTIAMHGPSCDPSSGHFETKFSAPATKTQKEMIKIYPRMLPSLHVASSGPTLSLPGIKCGLGFFYEDHNALQR
jgi:hypothetical protein